MRASNQSSKVVRIRRGGQITIPVEFRRRLGIDAETLLRITVEDGELRVSPVPAADQDAGPDWLDTLFAAYAPIRAEILAGDIGEEEINSDIDTAIAEVRAAHRSMRG